MQPLAPPSSRAAAELVAAAVRRPSYASLDLDAIAELGIARGRALAVADETLDAIAERIAEAGSPHGAVEVAHRLTGIARTTLTRRLHAVTGAES